LRIRNITITNVRGISHTEITCDIHPNVPTFFVAPNGFGKTSIATAFNSMNRNRIELQDDDRFKNSQTALPEIKITNEAGEVFIANTESNTIINTFSVCVINSQIKAKSTTRNFGNFSSSSASLIVEPVVLYNKIPDKHEFKYSFSDIRNKFNGNAKKLLINLTERIKDPIFVCNFFEIRFDLKKLLQSRNKKIIDTFLKEINQIDGSKNVIENTSLNSAKALLNVDSVHKIIEKFSYLSEYPINKILVNIIQLRELYCANENQLANIFNYYTFLREKNEINELLSLFNCTWKNIKAKKLGQKFIIEFPNANHISNGERDVLYFIGKLFEARSKLNKNKSILIVDEIFDYLDDANLIAAQYFLTKFINHFKVQNKELFLIILTHLDPMYFNTYSFSTKNVFYLDRSTISTNKYKVYNLLKDRENCKKNNPEIYERVSSHFLHYSTKNIDESAYLHSLGVDPVLFTSISFRQKAIEELENYKNNREYDPALVCCGLRLYIEQKAYEQLSDEYKSNFLSLKTTTGKLKFAKEKGVNIPEVYFLLSIIYNEAMHLDSQCQKIHPISCKLRNKVIHHMIVEI